MRLVTEVGLMDELHVGRTLAREIGQESGARVNLGRRVLYDLDVVYSYISTKREEQNATPAK